jgi:hypothetical protein
MTNLLCMWQRFTFYHYIIIYLHYYIQQFFHIFRLAPKNLTGS